MAIYKPSNLSPELQEIDVNNINEFSCQVNTSGESVKGYKIQILSGDGSTVLYDANATDIPTPIKNKNFLKINLSSSQLGSNIPNGKNYQWNIRTYNDNIGSSNKPNTLICNGFLVGSTKYVIWTKNNDKLEYDRYIEISTTGTSNIMPLQEGNPDNIVLPGEEEVYRERHKISWVEKELGWNKDITKLELDDSFVYNYIDGTPFTIYQCSDQHTLNSVYVDPNDIIERGRYIELNGDIKRKIIGYGEETGEVRVQEPFSSVPTNGTTYKIYEASGTGASITYKEITSEINQVVGGSPISDSSFVIITNKWDESNHRLFIQPNINIKSDLTNPNEIYFPNQDSRVDIIQTISTSVIPGKNTDITFNKLDNTQWMLEYLNTTDSNIPIIPQTPYSVYTDFMDSQPYCMFYARSSPVITMKYKNLNDNEDGGTNYVPIDNSSKPWRDIAFKTNWSSQDEVQVKYYQYFLYDVNNVLISESEEIYNSDLEWYFRGFQTSDNENVPIQYKIQIKIVDELDKEFEVSNIFNIFYNTNQAIVPLSVNLNCDKQAIEITTIAPVYVETTDKDGIPTVDSSTLISTQGYLKIPEGKILNYTNVVNPDKTPIEIPATFSYFTQFQISGEFLDQIPDGKEQVITEIGSKNLQGGIDIYSLKMSSFKKFYFDPESNTIQTNPNCFQMRWYKNNEPTPLQCFGQNNYFDILTEDPYKEFVSPQSLSYALQESSDFIITDGTDDFMLIDGQKYIFTQDYTWGFNNKTYLKGAYLYTNNNLVPIINEEYVFIENLNQIQDSTFETLSVPENCQGEDNNLLWTDDNNSWIDTSDYINTINKQMLSKKWFRVYLIVNNNVSQNNVSCIIKIYNNREGREI